MVLYGTRDFDLWFDMSLAISIDGIIWSLPFALMALYGICKFLLLFFCFYSKLSLGWNKNWVHIYNPHVGYNPHF